MGMRLWHFLRGPVLALAAVLGGLTVLSAADGGFSATLAAPQRDSAGLAQLSADQLVVLDRLVADDLASARQLKATELSGRFSARHTDAQRQAAGLDRLSAAQRDTLDELVAGAIAAQPLPRERPRLKDNEVVSLKRRLEVHGGMSFTYGWASGGGNYRGASAWVDYYDPVSGLGLSVGFSRYTGDLPYYGGWWPGYYDGGLYGYGDDYLSAGAYREFASPALQLRGGIFAQDGGHRGGWASGPGGRRY